MSQIPSLLSREAGTSQPASRSTRRRPSASHLLVAFAVVLAFVLNILALQGQGASVLVAVADQPIAAGTPLTAEMVRLVPVDAGFEGVESLLGESEVASRIGWIVQRAVAESGVLEKAALAEAVSASGLRAMSVPVPIPRAAGGTIVTGDRIDIIAVRDDLARYVISGVEVLAVAGGGAGFSSVDHHLVVAVNADQALALAGAIATGAIDVVRSTGAPDIVESVDEP